MEKHIRRGAALRVAAAGFGSVAAFVASPVRAGAEQADHMSGAGLVTAASRFSVRETVDRLERAVKAGGNTVFARIDHAGAAAAAGLTLRPTELLIFGNPKSGTAFMIAAQTFGIDLPMKILAWEDAHAKTFITYNDIAYLAARHGTDGLDERIGAVQKAYATLAASVAQAP